MVAFRSIEVIPLSPAVAVLVIPVSVAVAVAVTMPTVSTVVSAMPLAFPFSPSPPVPVPLSITLDGCLSLERHGSPVHSCLDYGFAYAFRLGHPDLVFALLCLGPSIQSGVNVWYEGCQ